MNSTTACKWDSVIPFDLMWIQLNRIIKDNGAICLFGSEPFSSALRMSNIKNYKYDWYWNKNKKTGFLNAKKQPLRRVENICVFSKTLGVYNPQKTTGHKPINSYTKHTSDGETMNKTKLKISGGGSTERFPDNVINIPVINNDSSNEKRLHPTQKPVDLIEYLIETYTNEQETVLDFTSGSSTTAIACMNTDRKYICIEKDEEYYKLSIERIKNHVIQGRLF